MVLTLTATAAELNAVVNAELIENIRVEDTSGLIATQNGCSCKCYKC